MGSNFCEGFSMKNDIQTPIFFKKTACNLLKFHKPSMKLPNIWLRISEINSKIVSRQMIGIFFREMIIFWKTGHSTET